MRKWRRDTDWKDGMFCSDEEGCEDLAMSKRRSQEEPVGRILELEVTGRRHWERPKKGWRKIVEIDVRLVEASEIYAQHRAVKPHRNEKRRL